MSEVQFALETFKKYGINASVINNNQITISHFCQPKGTTFEALGINENELLKNIAICEGKFDTTKSKLTTFELSIAKEIVLDKETNIKEMPNLKAVGILVANENLKKLPKLKAAGSISFENGKVKALPKLKNAGVIIAQNSALTDLSALENISKLCIIDCPEIDLKNLEKAQDIFICSSDENKKIGLKTLPKLSETDNLFVANATLKSLPKLKTAKKIGLYNCEIKSLKSSIKAETEIKNQINDEELNQKFDTFTDWYNSGVLEQSMELLGNIVSSMNK